MKKLKVAWVLFAKPPIAGFAKNRISMVLGNEVSLSLYKLWLRWHWDNFREIGSEKDDSLVPGIKVYSTFFLFMAQPLGMGIRLARKYFYEIGPSRLSWRKKIKFREQKGKNLGERLANAILSLKKNFDLIVIWGSDAAVLTADHLKKVLLYHTSACIIPAYDGGYNLIAVRSDYFKRELFDNILWSSPKTFKMQKKRFDDLNIPLYIMDKMPDIDTPSAILRTYLYMKENECSAYQDRIEKWSRFWEDQRISLEDLRSK